jgi:hypothetical protein
MAHPEIARHPRPAQIEIAVAQAQIFIRRLGVDRKRENVGPIENLQFVRHQLNVAGRQLRIFCPWDAGRHFSFYLNNIFMPEVMSFLGELGVLFRPKNDLRQAFAISQIDEDHPAMIAPDMDPAGESGRGADVLLAEFVAMMRAIHASSL